VGLYHCCRDFGTFGGLEHLLRKKAIDKIMKCAANRQQLCIITGHFTFIDDMVGSDTLWINWVRDPISSAISQLTFESKRRAHLWKSLKISAELGRCFQENSLDGIFRDFYCDTVFTTLHTISGRLVRYFCGQDIRCETESMDWRLNQAKKNAYEHYQLIGVLEFSEISLSLLMQTLSKSFPQFNTTVHSLAHENSSRKKGGVMQNQVYEFINRLPGMTHDKLLYEYLTKLLCWRARSLELKHHSFNTKCVVLLKKGWNPTTLDHSHIDDEKNLRKGLARTDLLLLHSQYTSLKETEKKIARNGNSSRAIKSNTPKIFNLSCYELGNELSRKEKWNLNI